MAKYEYRTLLYGTPERGGLRRWVITAASADSESAQVGAAEKSRHVGRVWQALHLLETALRELDAEGWEFVSTSFAGGLFGFFGTAVLRRSPAAGEGV